MQVFLVMRSLSSVCHAGPLQGKEGDVEDLFSFSKNLCLEVVHITFVYIPLLRINIWLFMDARRATKYSSCLNSSRGHSRKKTKKPKNFLWTTSRPCHSRHSTFFHYPLSPSPDLTSLFKWIAEDRDPSHHSCSYEELSHSLAEEWEATRSSF